MAGAFFHNLQKKLEIKAKLILCCKKRSFGGVFLLFLLRFMQYKNEKITSAQTLKNHFSSGKVKWKNKSRTSEREQ